MIIYNKEPYIYNEYNILVKLIIRYRNYYMPFNKFGLQKLQYLRKKYPYES